MGRFIDADGKHYYFEPGKEGSLTAPYNKEQPKNDPKPAAKTVEPNTSAPDFCPNCSVPLKAKVIVGSSRG